VPLSYAAYSIDNQTSTTFQVSVTAYESGLYNQILFQTAKLSPGHHKLVVVYLDNNTLNNVLPLTLDYFVVFWDAASFTSGPPTNSSSTSSSTTTNHTGAIIGGVIGGGLVVLLLSLIIVIFTRRRNNRRAEAQNEQFPYVLDPLIVSESPSDPHPTSTLLSRPYTSDGQSLTPPTTFGKFTQRSSPSDASITSSNMISTSLRPMQALLYRVVQSHL